MRNPRISPKSQPTDFKSAVTSCIITWLKFSFVADNSSRKLLIS